MTARRKIMIQEGGYDMNREAWDELERAHNLEIVKCFARNEEEFLEIFKNKDIIAMKNTILGVKQIGGYSDGLYQKLKDRGVQCICHQGAGYDSINAAECNKVGIQVTNTPEAVAPATADTAVYLLMGALRNFNALAMSCRRGEWLSNDILADEAGGKVLGILGLGGIGANVRDKAKALFDFKKIQYHNRRPCAPEIEKDSEYIGDFDTFLKTSDVIYISVPLNKSTYHLFNKETFEKCKDGVYIINTARGAVIDENSLVDALASGKVKSVGLDVYENEPKIHPDLLANENVMLLPHAGASTIATRVRMERQVIRNLDEFLRTGKAINIVPECR